MLSELRDALRQQHDAAEAMHAAAIGDEEEAERTLMQAAGDLGVNNAAALHIQKLQW